MFILGLGVVAMTLIWMLSKRIEGAEPVVRRSAGMWALLCVGAALALRAGQLLIGLVLVSVAFASLAVWLRGRGGDDGPGDDGRDSDPPDRGPGGGRQGRLPVEQLDGEAFDRARAEWEQELHKRG